MKPSIPITDPLRKRSNTNKSQKEYKHCCPPGCGQTQPMKILIAGITYPPAFNGQSIFTGNLAEGLVKDGHTVWMAMPSDKGRPFQEERNGVHVFGVRSTDFSTLHNQAYVPFFPEREVQQIFKMFTPDVVHIHDHYPLSVSILRQAHSRGIPVVGTNHFVPENLAPYVPLLPKFWSVFSRLLWWWMKRVYNRLDLVTAPSMTAVNILKSQNLIPPLFPVSCGVDFSRFFPDNTIDRRAVRRQFNLDEDKTTFLFVGRVDAEKKVDEIILALQRMRRDDIQFVVTGIGAHLPALKNLADQAGLNGQVHFTGFIPADDLPRLLNSVDVFLMPSEAELLSIASLEAMSTGLPLLVARSKALPELVQEGVNGYTFIPGDIDDVARCMKLMADQPDRLPEMGAASLQLVQKHSLENVIKRYEALYQNCMEQVYCPEKLIGVPSQRTSD